MRTLNLGVLAHVDAGKTSLTERLLHAAGVIDAVGSVDAGTTQSDSLALERQRGITIKSAVVSFVVDDVTVNLIDTPGHPDFIAEVERVLSVLDGAVLVVSAVEGVQAQTRVLMRALQRLGVPTLVFINKIDRTGADARVVVELAERLGLTPMVMGSVVGLGGRGAVTTPYGAGDAGFTTRLVDVLTQRNDALLAAYVDGDRPPSYRRLRRELADQTAQAAVHPVFFGSAVTGAGIDPLVDGLTELLPGTEGDALAPVSAVVFKVERGVAGEPIAYLRMWAGTLRLRDRVAVEAGAGGGRRTGQRVTAISVFERGSAVPVTSVSAGRIAKVWGLDAVTIGSIVGSTGPHPAPFSFPPPTLETVVVAQRATERGALHVALAQLAEQDPLINLREDDEAGETALSLYGEVQKEVIGATLATEFGIDVGFRASTVICIERLVGTGSAAEPLPSTRTTAHPHLAGLGLRLEPAPPGAGIVVDLEIERGSLPRAFRTAVEETVPMALSRGLRGWQVPDCRAVITSSGYAARQSHSHATFDRAMSSTADDFRRLTSPIVARALARAGTRVCEPVHSFRLEIPADQLGVVLPFLAQVSAVPRRRLGEGTSYALEGEIPAAHVHRLQQQLPTVTRGEGVLECAFDHYRAVPGAGPRRPPPVTRMTA